MADFESPLPGTGHRRGLSHDPLAELQSPFVIAPDEQEGRKVARDGYVNYTGKDPLAVHFMRSIVDPSHGIELDPANPFERVILGLRDIPAIQRMKYVSQVSAASSVYLDAVHSRFPHILGSAELAAEVLNHLCIRASDRLRRELEEWGPICVAFAMLHDVGHISPGSHVAHRVWFEGKPDCHEEMSHMLLKKDLGLRRALEQVLGVEGADRLNLVVAEDQSVPRWAWQLITTGGWNADRGDWVRRDSVMSGTHYGGYEIPLIKKNLVITDSGDLAIREGGVEPLEAFFSARFNMYRSVYYHPACRIGEWMHVLVGRRARELFAADKLEWADPTMRAILSAESGNSLDIHALMNTVEYRWLYHVDEWSRSADATLSVLSRKLLQRQLFKSFPDKPEVEEELRNRAIQRGLNPAYFVVRVPPCSVKLAKDLKNALPVYRNDGTVSSLVEYSPLMRQFNELGSLSVPGFIAAPEELFTGFTAH